MRRDRLYREIDKIMTDQFMLGIEIEVAGSRDLPNVRTLRRELERWLRGLDPDAEVSRAGNGLDQLPTFRWEDAGWSLVFEALAIKAELRGQPIDRPLGMFMDETGGLIDDETPLRRALERKAPRRYGALEHPYVIAVCESSWEYGGESWHRRNTLFGGSAIAYGDGNPPRGVRTADGYWRGPGNRPRNKRVAAVLLAAHLEPWRLEDEALTWWDNPFAATPMSAHLVLPTAERHQVVFPSQDGRGEFVVTGPAKSVTATFDVELRRT